MVSAQVEASPGPDPGRGRPRWRCTPGYKPWSVPRSRHRSPAMERAAPNATRSARLIATTTSADRPPRLTPYTVMRKTRKSSSAPERGPTSRPAPVGNPEPQRARERGIQCPRCGSPSPKPRPQCGHPAGAGARLSGSSPSSGTVGRTRRAPTNAPRVHPAAHIGPPVKTTMPTTGPPRPPGHGTPDNEQRPRRPHHRRGDSRRARGYRWNQAEHEQDRGRLRAAPHVTAEAKRASPAPSHPPRVPTGAAGVPTGPTSWVYHRACGVRQTHSQRVAREGHHEGNKRQRSLDREGAAFNSKHLQTRHPRSNQGKHTRSSSQLVLSLSGHSARTGLPTRATDLEPVNQSTASRGTDYKRYQSARPRPPPRTRPPAASPANRNTARERDIEPRRASGPSAVPIK